MRGRPTSRLRLCFFFFNGTATTEIYTFPYTTLFRSSCRRRSGAQDLRGGCDRLSARRRPPRPMGRSEEHTSELQSRGHLVCRLLLEKKKKARNLYDLEKKKKKKQT